MKPKTKLEMLFEDLMVGLLALMLFIYWLS